MWKGKVNKIRTLGLLLIFAGFVIMYIALMLQRFPILMYIFMGLGFLSVLSSVFIYFFVGLLSMKSATIECPRCHKVTKVLGVTDECAHCGTTLTFDPKFKSQ